MFFRHVHQYAKYHRTYEAGYKDGAHKSNPHGAGYGRRVGDVGVHSFCDLQVSRPTRTQDISVRMGRIRTVPYAFHAAFSYNQYRPHAHFSRLEVHRHQVSLYVRTTP